MKWGFMDVSPDNLVELIEIVRVSYQVGLYIYSDIVYVYIYIYIYIYI